MALTRVPPPGRDWMVSAPPTAAIRSRMLLNPIPAVTCVGSKPAPSSRTSTRRSPSSESSMTAAVAPAAC